MPTLQAKFEKPKDARAIKESCLEYEIKSGTDDWALRKGHPAWLTLTQGGKIRITADEIKSAKQVELSEILKTVINPFKVFNLFRISTTVNTREGWDDLKYIVQDSLDHDILVFYKARRTERKICRSTQEMYDEGINTHYFHRVELDCGLNVKKKQLTVSERALSNYYPITHKQFSKQLLKIT